VDPEQIVAELEENAVNLETDANPQGTIALARVSEEIARTFHVRRDEVAILVLVEESKHLQFLIPEKLKGVGTIPLTSTTALAARTARDKRPELINKFNRVTHASVFEGVPLGRGHGEQIHRIMSAPIAVEGKVVGVVQVSRKGRSAEEAGAEFSQNDLRGLVALSSVLGRLVKVFSW
jgi:transcriptional regulator with GAF, ATPase, and Fis domain